MIIPYNLLDKDTLQNLVEEFVSRDGTDNGYDETLSRKVEQVLYGLQSGELAVVFDHESQTPNILPKEAAQRLAAQSWDEP